MKRLFVLVIVLAALVTAAPARAITIGFSPSSQTVDVGDLVFVDVVVSGLDAFEEIVAAYDLDVTYNPAIVSATGVVFGNALGDEALFEVFNDFDILTPGRIDFAAVSLLDDQDVNALQGDSVVLATLSFIALNPGTTPLIFDPVTTPSILIVSFGAIPPDPVDALSGEIIVRGPVQTPEPSTLWLGLVGLLAARKLRRRRVL